VTQIPKSELEPAIAAFINKSTGC